jgi:CRISPR-associated protein Cmr2
MNTRTNDRIQHRLEIAIAWCLAYSPEIDRETQLQALREYFNNGSSCGEDLQKIVAAVTSLMSEDLWPETIADLQALIQKHPLLWNNRIGMVYGGATKIKQYVFESPKLQEIRGASALLDNINLVDLPAFFHGDEDISSDYFAECKGARAEEYCQNIRSAWLEDDLQFKGLAKALIPELIIYSTGGNILAFCPEAVINQLANAIEKRYTSETLTANSCAVGETFKPLEIRLGLLPDEINTETFWFADYQKAYQNNEDFMSGYIPCDKPVNEKNLLKAFKQRKSFNELTSKLAVLFNKRRSGNFTDGRPSRQFPVMFETHPYLQRDGGDRRSAIAQVKALPGEPWYSESIARKRLVGQKTKIAERDPLVDWYKELNLKWPLNREIKVETWISRYEKFLEQNSYEKKYFRGQNRSNVSEARSLIEIGNASKGFVGYIYADGNNMGGYIQKIETPGEYQEFSQDIFKATEQSVYQALFENLHPHELHGLTDPERQDRNGKWIHPFEIITIGGDDVMLIVPADKALAIAKTLGDQFEVYLAENGNGKYFVNQPKEHKGQIHRYFADAKPSVSSLSMSTGMLITADATPIYYATNLTEQLLKSAKEKAKQLKKLGYHGGTVDFMVLKTVTMISSDIKEFRQQGLTKTIEKQKMPEKSLDKQNNQKLKFYAAPYTLHELGGLLNLLEALRKNNFPKSQLYQIRSLLERGKRTAILNYRYFRVRLDNQNQLVLKKHFEDDWCKPKTNDGNLAPWMHYTKINDMGDIEESGYETIWRDLVDLYDFSFVEDEVLIEEEV